MLAFALAVVMALSNTGFETGDFTDWLPIGDASVSDSYGAHTGTYAGVLDLSGTGAGSINQIAAVTIFNMEVWEFSCWVKLDSAGTGGYVSMFGVTNIDGPVANVQVYQDGTVEYYTGGVLQRTGQLQDVTDWNLIRFTFEATKTDQLGVGVISDSADSVRWLVDNFGLEEGTKLITNTLFDAFIDDLEDIDGTGIFVNNVGTVYREPVPTAKMVFGSGQASAAVYPEVGGETEGLTKLTNVSEQKFGVHIARKSTTPHTDVQKLIDDVRNAVERADGNLATASGATWRVEHVDASDWTEILPPDDLQNKMAIAEVVVAVVYKYERGSA